MLLGPMSTADWMTGPGSAARKPNHGNNQLPVRRAERTQDTGKSNMVPAVPLIMSDLYDLFVQYLVVRGVELIEEVQIREGVGQQRAQEVFIQK